MAAKLTKKEQAFINAYLKPNSNGTSAAITAGYSAKTAAQAASRLLKQPKIREALNAATQVEQNKATIVEVKQRAITTAYILETTQWIIEKHKQRAPQAALRGLELLAKYSREFPDSIALGKSVESMTDEEIKQMLIESREILKTLKKDS